MQQGNRHSKEPMASRLKTRLLQNFAAYLLLDKETHTIDFCDKELGISSHTTVNWHELYSPNRESQPKFREPCDR